MALSKYKKEFLLNFIVDAERVCPEYGVNPQVCVAQAILESGWGFARLRRLNRHLRHVSQAKLERKRGYNYFGIKGVGDAGTQVWKTKEYKGTKASGEFVVIEDTFARFSSREAGIHGYCQFITKDRYSAAADVFLDHPARYITYIWAKGYATGIDYPNKIVSVMNSVAKHSGNDSYEVTIDEKLDIIIKKLQSAPAGPRRWKLCDKLFKKDKFGLDVNEKDSSTGLSRFFKVLVEFFSGLKWR